MLSADKYNPEGIIFIMIENKVVALIFRSVAFLIILYGLLIHTGLLSGSLFLNSLMFYTILSNFLALVMFGILLVKTVREWAIREDVPKAEYFDRFEMICSVDLLLTLVVYWGLLAPNAFSMGQVVGLFSFENLSVHLFAPLMCLADYILFTKSHALKYKDIYMTLIFPLFYLLFVTIAGFVGYIFRYDPYGHPIRFPYYFFDYDRIGAGAFLYIGGLVVFFLILSHIFYFIDKKWEKPKLI